MSFEKADQMNAKESNGDAAENVKKCADALQTDKKSFNQNDTQKQDPYVQKLLTQGAIQHSELKLENIFGMDQIK